MSGGWGRKMQHRPPGDPISEFFRIGHVSEKFGFPGNIGSQAMVTSYIFCFEYFTRTNKSTFVAFHSVSISDEFREMFGDELRELDLGPFRVRYKDIRRIVELNVDLRDPVDYDLVKINEIDGFLSSTFDTGKDKHLANTYPNSSLDAVQKEWKQRGFMPIPEQTREARTWRFVDVSKYHSTTLWSNETYTHYDKQGLPNSLVGPAVYHYDGTCEWWFKGEFIMSYKTDRYLYPKFAKKAEPKIVVGPFHTRIIDLIIEAAKCAQRQNRQRILREDVVINSNHLKKSYVIPRIRKDVVEMFSQRSAEYRDFELSSVAEELIAIKMVHCE
jgi:hypothetical protein